MRVSREKKQAISFFLLHVCAPEDQPENKAANKYSPLLFLFAAKHIFHIAGQW